MELKKHKGQLFPTEDIFEIYKKHPLRFFLENVNEILIQIYDGTFVFYLIYDRKIQVRIQDVDHIHPSSLLERANVDFNAINTIMNYQLLDSGTNRYEKNGKPLNKWIANNIENRKLYLEKHLIPSDETLWNLTNYQAFIDARSKLIVKKIENIMSSYS